MSETTPAVLVTGAARGLGAVMVEHLAAHGYTVFAGMREPTTVPSPEVVPVRLDVTDPSTIASAVAEVADRVGDAGLAGLVNNAAVLRAGPLELAPLAAVEEQLRTNVVGPIAVTQAALPLLRSARGRIVNVSSINAQLPMPYWALYSASKAALVALSDAWRMELAPWGVDVTVLTLGAFRTDIREEAARGWVSAGDDDPYESARLAQANLVAMLDATAADPRRVGEGLIEVLAAPVAPAAMAIGDGIEDLLALSAEPAEVRQSVLAGLLAAPG